MDPTPFYYSRGFINHTDHRAVGEAVIDAVYPMARDRSTFEELSKEGLGPHRVRTLYLMNFEGRNHLTDISKTIGIKMKALACHRSQVSRESVNGVKTMSRMLGKEKGYAYAEGFVKLEMP